MALARELSKVVLPVWVAPGTPSAWVTLPPAPLPRRLAIKGSFAVIDPQQRRQLDQAGVRRSPRAARSAHQRRRTDQRLEARAAQLGFASLHAYLTDRVTLQAWSLAQVARDLGSDPATVRDRLDHHGLRRTRQTPAQRDGSRRAAERNRARGQARRAARLAALGSADLQEYLRMRRVVQGWPMWRLRAELGVDLAWLRRQMTELGIP